MNIFEKLKVFEGISPATAKVSAQGVSIFIEQPCGCKLVEHPLERNPQNSEGVFRYSEEVYYNRRYFVTLCNEHESTNNIHR